MLVALWLQTEAITFSCCTFSPSIHSSKVMPADEQETSIFTSSLPLPNRGNPSGISKCSRMLEGIWQERYETRGQLVLGPPDRHNDCRLDSLLQKGESGQKTERLIRLSSNLILIFRRCKGELQNREADE